MMSLPEEKYEALSVSKITDLREAFTAGRALGRDEAADLMAALDAWIDPATGDDEDTEVTLAETYRAFKEQT